jgi:uncharacterized protein YbjT (DUF2867 family)
MTILVIGGTGLVGSHVVEALASAGHAARATSRRPAAFPPGVEGAAVDLADAPALRSALDGVRAVFTYATPGTARLLVEQMAAAGVHRLVLLSSADAASNDMSDFNCRRHREVEIAIEQSRLDWTFLRPVAFASNALFWKEQIRATGVVRSPFPNASQSLIDPRDIGRVAAAALTSGRLVGEAPILTGPESLTQLRQVDILGAALGRPIAFEAITPEAMRTMLSGFLAPEYIDLKLTALADAERHPDPVTDAVGTITGQPPASFAQWAKRNAAAFL